MKIAQIITKLMNENKYTQTTLAEALGVRQATVSSWVTGRTTPSVDDIIKMSELFEVSLDTILGIAKTREQKIFENSPIVVGNTNANIAIDGSTIGEPINDELIALYNSFSAAEKSILLGYAKRIVEERKH